MANKYTGSEVAKKNRPNSKVKVSARRAARKESGMSAQKYYVQTRMAEAAKSGKTLDRAALRKKFQSGDVSRKGFGAPVRRSSGSSSSSSKKTDTSPTTDSSSRRGYQSPTSRTSTSSRSATPMRGADAYSSNLPKVQRSSKNYSPKYSQSKKGENRVGKFIKNELLGVDDFKRVGKYVKSGQYGKAAKSLGAGVFELGSSAATLTGAGAAIKGATALKTIRGAAAVTKGKKGALLTKIAKGGTPLVTAAKETAKTRAVLKGGQIGSAALVRSGDKNKNKSKPNPYRK